ncbi:MAG: Cof-type HAD-IIB family hydrolase [Bacteroidaceae bacterium]|nr:Cof-type HAD-IIB family hydrolase [Bacteroidaceae bacterium]
MTRFPRFIQTPIHAVFLDIDGTLVSFRTHAVSPQVRSAISMVRGKGVKVIIATGRPLPFVDNLGDLEYDGIMTVNGACCQTSDGTVIRHNPIPAEDIQMMVEYCHAHPLPMAFTSSDEAYSSFTTPEFIEVFRLLDIKIPPHLPIHRCLGKGITQIVAFISKEDEPRIMQEVFPHCTAHRWHPAFADIISSGNSKEEGVCAFCRHLHIPLSQTMAFGDGGNDIGMLNRVGYGFAMSNARPEVLDKAPFVTESVDEDGVAKALFRFFS